jgi:hypothetical protein
VKAYRPRQVEGLGNVLCVLLAVAGLGSLINGIINVVFWRDALFIVPLSERGEAYVNLPAPSGPLPGLIGGVSSLAGITTVVIWLVWQHEVTANLWARGFPGLRTTPGWAVGWWFVPFANLVMPFLAVREVDRRSSTDGTVRTDRGLVGWWWAAYLLSTVGLAVATIAVFASQARRFIDALDAGRTSIDLTQAMRQAASWGVVGGVASAVAAGLAILVVRRISRNQREVLQGSLPPRPDRSAWVPLPPG